MTADMPDLAGIERQPHAKAVLGGALPPHGNPSHAYLLGGPAGSGKRTVARAFAAELLAEGAKDLDSVRARVQRGSHPDLTWVTPSGAHELLVSDVDQAVVAAASRTPFEANRRVFVIERADTMIEQAANRMLKTLEEPAPFVHLLLISDRPTEVLPTIASRCQHVRFDPLPPDEIAALLQREHTVEPAIAQACARLALGDAARAQALATGGGPNLRASAERFARAALHGDMGERPWNELLRQANRAGDAVMIALKEEHEATIELLAKRDRRRAETEHNERAKRAQRREQRVTLEAALSLIGLWYRDCACVAYGAPELACHADRADELAADAKLAAAARLRHAHELVEDTRARLVLNVTEELALEALGYRLERELTAGAPAATAG